MNNIQNPKPVITFARWGNYTIAFKTLFEKLGIEVIPPEETNPQTIIEGARIAPEMYCFPMKVTLGNYLPALKKGANTILMVQNIGGSCRQRYYGIIQEKALKEAGHNINFIDFKATPKDIYSEIKGISGASFWQIIMAAKFFFQKLNFIEKIEKITQYIRPREIEKGATDRLLIDIFLKLEKINQAKELSQFKREALKKFSQIKIDKKKEIPRIGLIGEIYTTCDPTINFGIEKKLGLEGIETHREMNITYHIKKMIFPWKDHLIQRKINPYLKSTVGGHGRDAIYEMLQYTQKGFDGIIHLLPAFCMPEVSIRPILEKIHQESGIPFLSLSLDEQTAEAGVDTRIEAFIDVVKAYYNKKA